MSDLQLDINKQNFQEINTEDAIEIYNDNSLSPDLKTQFYSDSKSYKELKRTTPYSVSSSHELTKFKDFMSNPENFAIYNKASKNLQDIEEASEQYKLDNKNFISKWGYNFNQARLSQDAAATYSEYSDAIMAGDAEKAAELYREYALKRVRLNDEYKRKANFDNALGYLWYGSADLLASQANVESALSTLVGIGIAVATGGTSVAGNIAAGAAKGLIGYSRTKSVEKGSFMEEILQENPNSDYAKLYQAANIVGNVNAIVETMGDFVGAGSLAIKQVSRLVTKLSGKKVAEEATEEVVKQALKHPSFLKKILGIAKQVFVDPAAEGLQEVFQDSVADAAKDFLKDPKNLDYINVVNKAWSDFSDIEKWKNDPKKIETFLRTAGGTLLMGSIGFGANKIVEVQIDNARRKQNAQLTETIHDKATKHNDIYKALPLEERVNAVASVCPDNIIVSEQYLNKMQEAATKTDNKETKDLVSRTVENAKKMPDGSYQLNQNNFAEIVINEELFQTIKDDVSYDTGILTEAQEKEYVKNIKKEDELLKDNEETQEVYDSYVEKLSKIKDLKGKEQQALVATRMAKSLADEQGISLKEAAEKTSVNLVKEIKNKNKVSIKDKIKNIITGSTQRKQNGYEIKLSEATNPTTFLHEMNHSFMMQMIDLYNSKGLSEYWKANFEDACAWAGMEIKNGKVIENTKAMEKLAEGFTKYLKNGEAPTSSLKRIFAYFADLFTAVYKMLKMDNSIRLNKKITEFFDQMVATRDEITQKQLEQKVFLGSKPKDMDIKSWNKLLTEAQNILQSQTSKFMRAMDKKMAFEKSLEYKNKEKAIREEMSNLLMQDPVFQAQKYLLEVGIDPETIPEGIVVDRKYISKDGLSYDLVMEKLSGFDNPNEIIDAYTFDDILNEEVKNEMEAWMSKEFMFEDTDIEILTKDMSCVRMLLHRVALLKNIPESKFGEYLNEFGKEAENIIGNMNLKELADFDKQTKILNKLAMLVNNKNSKTLIETTEKLAMQMYATVRSNEIRNQVHKFNKNFKKYRGNFQPKKNNKVNGRVWDILQTFLYNNAYTKRIPANPMPLYDKVINYINLTNPAFDADVRVLTEQDFFKDVAQPKEIKSFDDINVQQFTDLYETMSIIENFGKDQQTLGKSEAKANLDETMDRISNHIEKNGVAKKELGTIKDFLLYGTQKETLLKKWFDEETFTKYVLPFMNAQTKQSILFNQMNKEINNIAKNHKDFFQNKFVLKGQEFTGEEIAAIVINSGNEGNQKVLMNTKKIQKLNMSFEELLSSLPREAFDIANELWAFFDKRKDLVQEKTAEINNGKQLKMVSATPMDIKLNNGEEVHLNGGYFPLVKDKKTNSAENLFGELTEEGLINVQNFPEASFQKHRIENDTQNGLYKLSLSPIFRYISNASALISMSKEFNDLSKIIFNRKLIESLGETRTEWLKDWMKSIAVGQRADKGLSLFNKLMSAASFSALSFRPISFVTQSLGGLSMAFAKCPVQYVIKGAYDTITNIGKFKDDNVGFKSEVMKARYQRYLNDTKDLFEGKSDVELYAKKGAKWVGRIGMSIIQAGDWIGTQLVWNAEYETQIAKGVDEATAILKADSMVRTTQGSNDRASKVDILTGNAKYMNKFMMYWFSVYSNIIAATEDNNLAENIMATSKMLVLLGVAGGMSALAKSSLNNWMYDDDEEDKDKTFINGFTDSVGNTLLPQFGFGSKVSRFLTGQRNFSGTVNDTYIMRVLSNWKRVYNGEGNIIQASLEPVSHSLAKFLTRE